MYPRVNYEMTEEDHTKLLEACKPTPAMWGSGGAPMFSTPQENANRAWAELGKKMGFDPQTPLPVPGKHTRFFTAVPSETEEQRKEREAREANEKRTLRVQELKTEIAAREVELETLLPTVEEAQKIYAGDRP